MFACFRCYKDKDHIDVAQSKMHIILEGTYMYIYMYMYLYNWFFFFHFRRLLLSKMFNAWKRLVQSEKVNCVSI